MKSSSITVNTRGQTEMVDITRDIKAQIEKAGITDGICMIYVPHTTAAVTINENADPDVKSDIVMTLNRIVPWDAEYRHSEGNSPAHVKATLVGESVMVAVSGGNPVLGTWQGIFFCEFDGPRNRRVNLNFLTSSR